MASFLYSTTKEILLYAHQGKNDYRYYAKYPKRFKKCVGYTKPMLEQYSTFFVACSQAASALVGLLFVALSIDVGLEREFRIKQYALSETAYISLVGIFVVSLLTLFPVGLTLIAGAAIIFSVVGSAGLLRQRRGFVHERLPMDLWYIAVTIGVYVVLAATSLWIMLTNGGRDSLNLFCLLFVILFGLSLIRAWRALRITKSSGARPKQTQTKK
jgi:hypothetical protein